MSVLVDTSVWVERPRSIAQQHGTAYEEPGKEKGNA